MGVLASLRERRHVGELASELVSARKRMLALQDTAGALITCVKALALDIDELGAVELKQSLDDMLAQVRAEAPPAVLMESMQLRQRDTLVFAEQERVYLETRDGELRRIIDVLKDGLSLVGAGNAAYDRTILEKSSRLEAASQLGDIVKLRQTISREVDELRKEVSKKQAQDTHHAAALAEEVEALRRDIEQARSAAATDPLTGAATRSAFDSELARLCDLAAAGGATSSLLMVDVDNFKQINDVHGHPVGDRVLVALVAFCRENVRRGDVVGRWGGDEFAVLLPSASLRVASSKAQRIVKELSKREWSVESERALSFTVSMGVTAWRKGDDPASLIARADQALYRAKRAGRNRAVHSG